MFRIEFLQPVIGALAVFGLGTWQTSAHDGAVHGNPADPSATISSDVTDWEGQTVNVFGARIVDVDGQVHRLGTSNDAAPFALVFIDQGCTVSNSYAADLNDFNDRAAVEGMQFYGVISDSLMSAKEAREFVRSSGFTFPVIWDSIGDLAHRVEPIITP